MRRLKAECPVTVKFTESFRSSPAVLAAVNSLKELTGGQTLAAAAPGSWPSGGLAGYLDFKDAKEESCYVTQFCESILSQGRAPRQRIGISARTKQRRRFVDAAIKKSGLPYFLWDDGVLDESVAQKIRSMLRTLSLKEYRNANDPHEFLRQAVLLDNEQDPDERTALSDAVDWCSDLLRSGENPDDIQKRVQIGNADSLIAHTGIHLLTGHAGKGQQFDWMIVVGLEEGNLPSYQAIKSNSSAEIGEEARTLAVMLSRARHGVLVTSSKIVPDANNERRRKQPSRFLDKFRPVVMGGRQQIHGWLESADWTAIAAV